MRLSHLMKSAVCVHETCVTVMLTLSCVSLFEVFCVVQVCCVTFSLFH